jgi:hypothetical protein
MLFIVAVVNAAGFKANEGFAFVIEFGGLAKVDSIVVAKQVNEPAIEVMQVLSGCVKINYGFCCFCHDSRPPFFLLCASQHNPAGAHSPFQILTQIASIAKLLAFYTTRPPSLRLSGLK